VLAYRPSCPYTFALVVTICLAHPDTGLASISVVSPSVIRIEPRARCPPRINVIALPRWRWATSELRMRGLSTSSTRPNALSPYLYGRYSAPKQRWWPLFACLGAGGMLTLALLPQPPDGAQSTQRPLVYSVAGSGVLVAARPAVKELAHVPRIPDQAADDSTTARIAETTPTRGKTVSGHSSKRRASGHRYAARKSHHREVRGYGRNGAYPRARYGFNGASYGGWSFN
jgi:hypothetical protein